MQQKSSFFLRLPVLAAALAIATCAASAFHAMRAFWVFYTPNLFFLGGSMGVFVLSLALIAFEVLLLSLCVYAPQVWEKWKAKKAVRVLAGVAEIFGAVILLVDIVVALLSGRETNLVIGMYLRRDLPLIAAFCALAVLVFALPLLKKKGKAILALVLALCFACAALTQVFPLLPYRLVSDPMVLDTGEDYCVVFATNRKGTGFVRYTAAGEEKTMYAAQYGRRIGDRLLHSVHVPYEALKNNAYEIGSTAVTEEFAYGSRLGKTVTAGPFTLCVNESKTQSYLCLSDWHSYLDNAKKAASYLGEYDALIMLGDPVTSMDFEEEAVRFVAQFGGDLTHGEKPVIYVRGNHETRGGFADDFPEYMGLEQLYYKVSCGDYSFLVLDSGEDKEDSHAEYGGMDDYAVSRKQELEWLQAQQKSDKKLIVLTHAWQFSEPEPEVSRAAWEIFEKLGASFVISGHMHVCEFLQDDESEQAAEYVSAYPDITAYIDGGHSGKTYIASKLTLSEQGVHFEAADNFGNTITDKTLEW